MIHTLPDRQQLGQGFHDGLGVGPLDGDADARTGFRTKNIYATAVLANCAPVRLSAEKKPAIEVFPVEPDMTKGKSSPHKLRAGYLNLRNRLAGKLRNNVSGGAGGDPPLQHEFLLQFKISVFLHG